MAVIGETFSAECVAAGVGKLPFSWSADGLGDLSRLTKAEALAVQGVLDAHDPTAKNPDPVTTKTAAIQSATTIAQLKAAIIDNLL